MCPLRLVVLESDRRVRHEEEIEVELTPAMRTLLASVPGSRLERKEPRPRDSLGRGSETLLLVDLGRECSNLPTRLKGLIDGNAN